MKIFIDTADLEEIKEAYSWGIIDGVTTNPSLIKKAVEKRKQKEGEIFLSDYIGQILKTAKETPVSLEVIGLREGEMLAQARSLYKAFYPHGSKIVIKIPINPSREEKANYDGLKVIKQLAGEGRAVNATLIMAPEQALLAAKAGARYVSPFAGRLDDYLREEYLGMKLNPKIVRPEKSWEKLMEAVESMENEAKEAEEKGIPLPEPKLTPEEKALMHAVMENRDFASWQYYPAEGMRTEEDKVANDNGIVSGVDLIRKTAEILKNYDFKTEVIAASIRNARQVREVALAGAHIATIPFYVLEEMIGHPKTAEGIRKFVEDAEKTPEYEALFKALAY